MIPVSLMVFEISGANGPELPIQVVQPKPTRLKPSLSSDFWSPEAERYSATTWLPGASEVLTQGLTPIPFAMALRASRPAPISTFGFEVFVQDVMAAITSCTNTSNPNVLIGAGLLARNAIAKGIGVKPWVKTSLAPGSQVVAEYLSASGLQKSLDKLGFNLVGFGCTTCIGNSGPLAPEISKTINDTGIIAAAVLSGNRNFEGRVSPDVQANYLASPPLVVAHALAGTVAIDLTSEPLGHDKKGHPVYLKDIWPSQEEITEIIDEFVTKKVFKSRYADVFN